MGITYKDLIFLLRGRVMKSSVGGVFGCPGSYLLGLPIITDNCRAKENFMKQDFDNSCRECWNAEVPYPVIAEVIGDTDFPGVPEEYFENWKGLPEILQRAFLDVFHFRRTFSIGHMVHVFDEAL